MRQRGASGGGRSTHGLRLRLRLRRESHPSTSNVPDPFPNPTVPHIHHQCITQERLLTIKDAAEALETARYQNLWAVLNSRAAVFDIIPNWRSEIRKSACWSQPHRECMGWGGMGW